MVNDGDFVAVFNSIHRVMKAEKILKGMQLEILLIPVPRALQSDCGLAIRYGAEIRTIVECELAKAELLPAEIYVKSHDQYLKV